MPITGLNYNLIHSCEDLTDGVTANTISATSNDTGDFKQGIASVYATLNATGESMTVTMAGASTSIDLTGQHVHYWALFAQGGLLENASDGGIQFHATGGGLTGKWYLDGRDTYPGGWKNYVIDIESTIDEGSQPVASDISSLGVEVHLNASAKNVASTWVDHFWYGDGLQISSDNAGTPYGLDDIMAQENTATDGGWGVLTKVGGIYYCVGELEFNEANFQAEDAVLVFEDRPVTTDLMGITIIDSDGTSSFKLGAESGGSGISGCVVRTGNPAQTAKYFFDASDTDITTMGLYGTTFQDAEVVTLPDRSDSDIEVLNSAFSASGEVISNLAVIKNTNFVSADATALRISTSDHKITDCNIIACPIGINFPTGGTYTLSNIVFSGCSDDLEFSAATTDTALVINAADGANPGTYALTGSSDLTSDDVTINNPIFHTITGLASDTEATYVDGNDVVLYRDSNVSSDGQVQYSYNYSSDKPITILITHLYYENLDYSIILGADNATLPVTQSTDPNYYNP